MTTTIALVIGGAGMLMLLLSALLRRRTGSRPVDPATLRTDVATALHRGDGLKAIKIYRERTGAGLLEARDEVDRIGRDRG